MTKQVNVVGVTGHRKLEHDKDAIKKIVKEKLFQYEADVVITGMALGFDMLVAEVCVEENIPFIAAIPCKGQTKAWTAEQRNQYVGLMEKCWKHKIVTPGPYQVWKLFERNRWIVNRSSIILSYWNGEDKGGTVATINEAKKVGRPHENLFPLCETK